MSGIGKFASVMAASSSVALLAIARKAPSLHWGSANADVEPSVRPNGNGGRVLDPREAAALRGPGQRRPVPARNGDTIPVPPPTGASAPPPKNGGPPRNGGPKPEEPRSSAPPATAAPTATTPAPPPASRSATSATKPAARPSPAPSVSIKPTPGNGGPPVDQRPEQPVDTGDAGQARTDQDSDEQIAESPNPPTDDTAAGTAAGALATVGDDPAADAVEAGLEPENAEPKRIDLFRRIRETRDTVRGELDPFARWAEPDPELFPARPAAYEAIGPEEPSAEKDAATEPAKGPDGAEADAVAKPEPQASGPAPAQTVRGAADAGGGRPLSRPLVSPWPEDDRPRPAQHRLEPRPVRPVELEWDPKPEGAAEAEAGAETDAERGLASDPGASGPAERPAPDPAPPLWDHHGEDLRPWLTSLLEHNRAATGSVRDYDKAGRGRTLWRALAVIAATLLISVLILALLVGTGVVDLQGVVDAVGVSMQSAPDEPMTAAAEMPGASGLSAALTLGRDS